MKRRGAGPQKTHEICSYSKCGHVSSALLGRFRYNVRPRSRLAIASSARAIASVGPIDDDDDYI